jgi:uncharacterized membrane protein
MSTIAKRQDETQPQRRFGLWHLSLVLVVLGLLVSGYLSFEHFNANSVVCVGGSEAFDCDAVNASIYSSFLGIYVGYLGLAADVLLLAVLLLERRIDLLRSYGVVIIFAVVLLGWLYHDFLTYVAFTRIGKLCIWCLTHHGLMTILLIVTSIRLYRTLFAVEAEDEE